MRPGLVLSNGSASPFSASFFPRGEIEREPSLQHGDAVLNLLEFTRVEVEEPAVAQRHGVNHADVDADFRQLHLRRLDLELGREDDEPMSAVFVHVNLPDGALREGAVGIAKGDGTRLAVADPADLRELHPTVGVVDVRRLELRNPKTVAYVLSLEPGPFLSGRIVLGTEAVPDRPVEIAKCLLKGLGHRFLEERSLRRLLPLNQFRGQFAVGEELFSGFPSFVLQRQGLVEHETPTPRVSAQGRSQGFVDVEFKLEAAEEFHDSLSYSL